MSPEKQRIAIAEACGWKPDKRGLGWLSPHGYYAPEPDYLNDLNAMHEAEKFTFRSCNLWQKFVFELLEVCGGSGMSELDGLCCLVQATAAQRAKALLRTIGKWEDSQ
jgi:hypothetical protein